MRERMRNVLVGLCSVGALGAASALLFLFGEIEPMLAKRWRLEVELNDAGGLRRGSLVTLYGVPVGSIDEVRWTGDPLNPVRVIAAINEGVDLPNPSTAIVQSSLLGSGARLDLLAQMPVSPTGLTYKKGETVKIRGKAESIEARMARIIEEQLGPLSAGFKEFSKLAKNLNSMLEESPEGAPLDADSLRTTIARINEFLAEGTKTITSIEKVVGSEQFQIDARGAVAGANELMGNANRAASGIADLASSLKQDAAAMRASAIPVLDQASAALQELQLSLATARAGKGTLGRLMQDPQLYEGLADAVKRADEAMAKLNLLIDKIRAEGLPIEFGSK